MAMKQKEPSAHVVPNLNAILNILQAIHDPSLLMCIHVSKRHHGTRLKALLPQLRLWRLVSRMRVVRSPMRGQT
jgi:hypothetical protein